MRKYFSMNVIKPKISPCQRGLKYPDCISCQIVSRPNVYPLDSQVGWGCRIYRLHFCRELRFSQGLSRIGHITPSDDEPLILDLWKMWITPLLIWHPRPLWLGILVWFGLVSSFNSISIFVGYLILKPFSKNRSGTIKRIAGRIRGFIPFPSVFVRKWT